MGSSLGALCIGAISAIVQSAHLFRSVQVGIPVLSRMGYFLRSQYFPMLYSRSLVVLDVFSLCAVPAFGLGWEGFS